MNIFIKFSLNHKNLEVHNYNNAQTQATTNTCSRNRIVHYRKCKACDEENTGLRLLCDLTWSLVETYFSIYSI